MWYDISEELLVKALNPIGESLNAMEHLGELKENSISIIMQRIRCVTPISEAVVSADLVIECLPKNLS